MWGEKNNYIVCATSLHSTYLPAGLVVRVEFLGMGQLNDPIRSVALPGCHGNRPDGGGAVSLVLGVQLLAVDQMLLPGGQY